MHARGESDSEQELAELMAAYQAGSLDAFEALYRRLAPMLLGYLVSLSWSRARAEDLLQETFLQMHRSRHTYQPSRPVKPWAFAIARHTFLIERRARARRSRVESLGGSELPEIPVPAEMERLATREEVLRALSGLKAERREAVLLHHVFGLTFAEIGGLLGIREGTAKLRAHRGIVALRDQLGVEP